MNKPRLIASPSITELGQKINEHLRDLYSSKDENFLVDAEFIRFNNGEGKCIIRDDISGCDLYILCDPSNYNASYNLIGTKHHMGPDEHYQDIKRAISASKAQAHRINVVMPLLYQSRQDKRKVAESLDCAMMLKELEWYGVKTIITIDAHNMAVENAIPFNTTLLNDTVLDNLLNSFNTEQSYNDLFVVSPDAGASKKADYSAKYLGITTSGFFEKRRNYNVIKKGQNPIEYHEFNGPKSLAGYDILLVDDLIASGSSLLSSMKHLKKLQANKIHLVTTFSLFTNGLQCFIDAHKEGLFNDLYTTNLSYIPKEYQKHNFLHIVDCSQKIAQSIFDNNNSL